MSQLKFSSIDSCFVGPITSLLILSCPLKLKTSDRLLLVGSGSFLSIFSLMGSSTLESPGKLYHKVLAHDRIHHLKLLEYDQTIITERQAEIFARSFVCAGGREFAICSLEKSLVQVNAGELRSSSSLVFNKLKALTIDDWIIDIDYRRRSSPGCNQITLLTAHNRLIIYRLEGCEDLREICSITCPDTTLLLSGQIRVQEQDQLEVFCVAAGSISGNVTIWKYWKADNQFQSILQVQTTLIGHRGAIYDLSFSPLGDMLCTASEDRSLRVWDFTSPDNHALVLWGHLGRVWRCHWWNNEQLTSVGEDCRALTWKISTPTRTPENLKTDSHSQRESSLKPFSIIQSAHDGRSIWSVTHDERTGYLLTGGADGKICSNLIEQHDNTPEIISKKITSTNRNSIKAFNVSSDASQVIYVCQDGSIYARFLFDKSCPERLLYRHTSIFRSQCHVRFVPGSDCAAFIATNHGHLLSVHDIGKSDPRTQLYNLMHAVTMLTVYLTIDLSIFALIYDCKQNVCLLYKLSENTDPKLVFRMCLRSMNTATSMKLVETTDPRRLLVFVGDVDGCLAVGEVSEKESHIGPIVSLHKDGILDIDVDQPQDNAHKNCLVLSTLGRDGNHQKCFIHVQDNQIKIFQIHQNPISKGSLEIFLDYPHNLCYISGFEKAYWKVFDLQTGLMIGSCKVACNGQPNMWFCRNRGNRSYLFYQQQGSILINYLSLPDTNSPISLLPNFGTHGREINCLKMVPVFQGLLEIVATGSENGVLELSLNQRHSTSRSLVKVYRNARVPFSVKCLTWLRDPAHCGVTQRFCDGFQEKIRDTLFLVISGSREMFQIFRVALDRHPEASSISEIYVGVMEWSSFSQRSAEESEVRIMDLDRLHLTDAVWLLSTSHSDGNIQVWTLDVVKKDQRLLFQYTTEYCVLSIQMLHVKVGNEKEILILAGLTDGTVRVLNLPKIDFTSIMEGKISETQTMNILLTLPHHQSGVRCVRSYSQNSRVIIATGGDDNCLVIQCLEFFRKCSTSLQLETKLVGTGKKVQAHASCINDVFMLGVNSLLDEHAGCRDRVILFSVSADQKLKIWSIDSMPEPNKPLEIDLVKILHTDVADCSSIDLVVHQTTHPFNHSLCIFLAGIGIESRVLTTSLFDSSYS